MLFQVKNMTCGGCAKSITRAIAAVDAAARIEADVARRLVRVESSANERDVLDAIQAAGYRAIVVPDTVHAPREGCCGCGGSSKAKQVDIAQSEHERGASCCGPSH